MLHVCILFQILRFSYSSKRSPFFQDSVYMYTGDARISKLKVIANTCIPAITRRWFICRDVKRFQSPFKYYFQYLDISVLNTFYSSSIDLFLSYLTDSTDSRTMFLFCSTAGIVCMVC